MPPTSIRQDAETIVEQLQFTTREYANCQLEIIVHLASSWPFASLRRLTFTLLVPNIQENSQKCSCSLPRVILPRVILTNRTAFAFRRRDGSHRPRITFIVHSSISLSVQSVYCTVQNILERRTSIKHVARWDADVYHKRLGVFFQITNSRRQFLKTKFSSVGTGNL